MLATVLEDRLEVHADIAARAAQYARQASNAWAGLIGSRRFFISIDPVQHSRWLVSVA
jgi:hypothetical protein